MLAAFDLIDKIKIQITLLDAVTAQPAANMNFQGNYAGKLWEATTDVNGKSTLPTVYNFMEAGKTF